MQCRSNNDCPSDEMCEGASCIKVCSRIRCGVEAQCIARGHTASCECNSGAHGNPWTACLRSECSIDDDCATWLACRGGICKDPCPGACAQGASCTVIRHTPTCECPQGTQGNPKIECKQGKYNIVYYHIILYMFEHVKNKPSKNNLKTTKNRTEKVNTYF